MNRAEPPPSGYLPLVRAWAKLVHGVQYLREVPPEERPWGDTLYAALAEFDDRTLLDQHLIGPKTVAWLRRRYIGEDALARRLARYVG